MKVAKLPRRKVVSAIAGLGSYSCELACGHSVDTGPWRTSWGVTRPAPKSMQCPKCKPRIVKKGS